MPLASVHLINLNPTTAILSFLKAVKSSNLKPLVISKVIRWVILPSTIESTPLLAYPWDLLLITPETGALPASLSTQIAHIHTTQVGIPSRLTSTFHTTNPTMLHPDPTTVPKLTGALTTPHTNTTSSQNLELSPSLSSWIHSFSSTPYGSGAISMLNFLAFKPNLHSEYLVYGRAFAESIGKRRGGNAKLVGNVVNKKEEGGWDEFALAHYPSVLHFADMLASSDYQEVNLKHRVGSLRDTCILCTSELAVEDIMGEESNKAKL